MPGTSQAKQWRLQSEEKPVVEVAASLDLSTIYDRWFDEVLRWIHALGGPKADCEDLVQDVFVIVHRRLHAFDGQNLGGWLHQITRHRVRDFRRLVWVRQMLFLSVPLSEKLTMSGASPADTIETQEKRDTLERLLDKLNESERAALVMFEVDGYSGEEIAELQGVPLNTVWARVHRGRKKLRAALSKLESQGQRGASSGTI
jgi:RNA polymerase sigma-70 factor (ECF subfamily)